MSKGKDTYIIIGAASGVGRNLAFQLAQKEYDLVITSRNENDINITANDLMCRFNNVLVIPKTLDLTNISEITAFSNWAIESYSDNLKGIYCTAGYNTDIDYGVNQSVELITLLIDSNYRGILLLLNPIIAFFEKRDCGLVTVFSSIAAATPRGRNNVYGSSKAALEYYYRSLQHYYSNTNVNIHIYALGYVDTSLSFGQKLKLPIANPEKIAKMVIKNRNNKVEKVQYVPSYWMFIIFILRHLPWFIYKRLKF